MTSTATPPLSRVLCKAATVELYDDSDGIFGELIHPFLVVSSLSRAVDLVGRIDNTGPTVSLQSQSLNDSSDNSEIGLEFDNASNETLRVRWIDNQGNSPPTHVWTVRPLSNLVQYTTAGDLFLISVITKSESDLYDASEEQVLGAYRPMRPLPSGSSHSVLIQGPTDTTTAGFILETMLLDETRKDALIVAASALDPVSGNLSHQKTLTTLDTIVSNVLAHPQQEKYRKLRLGNHKLERYIKSWGAMHFLDALGFRSVYLPTNSCDVDSSSKNTNTIGESTMDGTPTSTEQTPTEEFLILEDPTESGGALDSFRHAKELLGLLMSRSDAHFVAELAPPTPWQRPMLTTSASPTSRWNTRGTHFETADERWARTERVARLRRSGGGRPPPPGQAPSSRGRWGR